ncbi:anti-sigma factor domain-containing protein [Neorhizobium galegae]|uniref:anti-sigma factor n=1 Tax=Neorhizobium galegae TaxID=399 RepID=UPI0006210ABF|nr:anti-sigma factor [Neorhizobium galegae]CDZ26538.1 Anti-sigma-K factor RskA [Neorhizobium galegae bv. officinalis]KAA9383510.1 anti-sigma factor [Neorhizobium galegae]KAB1111643.1 anti-sigma factor [Neorhizobium galegae]MCM2500135.1 anti-sigma factor [Neorhizobium galegae]MCQ1768468.1 anti-sigma factor [Neorhizobium galegae]
MISDRKDIPAIADEYVLGLLDHGEAAQLEADMEEDKELMAAVAASRDRFLPLDMSIEPAAVNDSLWSRIEASLQPQVKPAQPSPPPGLNDNRAGWRLTAISAIAATVILAVGLAFSLMRTTEPVVVAVLVDEAGEVRAVIEDFGSQQAVIKMLADFDVPDDKTIQVWTLPSRDMGPVSLGLIDGIRSARLDRPSLPLPRNGQLYEITLEQAGGSPTGRPTGPILAKGLAKLPR